MFNGKLLLLTNFLLLMYTINSQFTLDTENLNYFECEDLTSYDDNMQKGLEMQNIHKIPNQDSNKLNNESQYYRYVFNNSRSDENMNSRPGTIKSQNFLKYKNFTLQKNFQIMLKIKKNPEFINNENTEKLNLEKMQKNGLYVWLMRNNKFSFESIRKNIEFNGLAFKIGEADIKLISSNKEKNNVIKPFFDSNNDYRSLTNQKTVNSNLREEAIKITAVKNLIFVERFNKAKGKWEMAFLENMNFYTIENFGINLEIISDIKDNSEAYSIEYLKICPIKSINYKIPGSPNNKDNTQNKNKEELKIQTNKNNQDQIDSIKNSTIDFIKFKGKIENLKLIDFISDINKKDLFISDLFALHEASESLENNLENIKIKNKFKLLSDEFLNEKLKPLETSRRVFNDMHDSILKFFKNLNSSISNSNNSLSKKQKDENPNDQLNIENTYPNNLNQTEMNLEILMNLNNEINRELTIIKENKNQNKHKILENFDLMKTNFYRIDKNLKIILADCDREIKSILNDLINNNENDFLIDLVDYLFIFVLSTMVVLLYLIYRYVNFIIDVPKDYVKLSRDINNVEKNNIS